MTLRRKKRRYGLATLGLLAAAAGVLAWGLEEPPLPEPARPAVREDGVPAAELLPPPPLAGFGTLLDKPLRRPLYDPPPPEVPIVAEQPRPPLQARLLATMIEANRTMAMLDLGGGRVEFRKVGDVIEADATIAEIQAGSIVVTRGPETITLAVEGT